MTLWCMLQEQSGHDKKSFMGYIKVYMAQIVSLVCMLIKQTIHNVVHSDVQPWLTQVIEKLPEGQQAEFKTKAQSSIKFLIGKIKDLQL